MPNSNQVYHDYLLTGQLWLQYCPQCQKYIFYPRSLCPHCFSSNLEWKPTSGRGHVYSFTVVRVSALEEFQPMIPYLYTLVELEEGVIMPTNLIDCSPEDAQVGMPVKLAIIEREDQLLPVFKPLL